MNTYVKVSILLMFNLKMKEMLGILEFHLKAFKSSCICFEDSRILARVDLWKQGHFHSQMMLLIFSE